MTQLCPTALPWGEAARGAGLGRPTTHIWDSSGRNEDVGEDSRESSHTWGLGLGEWEGGCEWA